MDDIILVNNFIQNINSLSVKKLEELKKISLKTKGMLNSFISKDQYHYQTLLSLDHNLVRF
jgi:hypothetical protein